MSFVLKDLLKQLGDADFVVHDKYEGHVILRAWRMTRSPSFSAGVAGSFRTPSDVESILSALSEGVANCDSR